ncbi:MAG TPA: DUF881 domain-containing protein [Acidimicrobiales bacterium]|jgi:uncharacterized protein YlxW (UPF0749 family)|nr:DUF881 domain-containing protein [Acidimicrobiales bacterium]
MPRSRLLLAAACALLGFLAVIAVRTRPADPEARLPRQYRLAALIDRQQRSAADLRREVAQLRVDVAGLRSARAGRQEGVSVREGQLQELSAMAGLVALKGPGLKVTLDDSSLDEAPTGNVNDLVIHSQDVQAVVNALWRAGAEAVAINKQRLVGTSAVLCVGNTLLLNGTVQSPPYVVTAVGAARDRFEADSLVRRLHDDAKEFGLRFSVGREDSMEVPAFNGTTTAKFARPTTSGGR